MNTCDRHDPTTTPATEETNATPAVAPASGGVLRIHSDQLFAGAHEVQILHLGAVYRLKQTALRKLILTK